MTKICHIISGYHRTDARVFQRQCKSLFIAGFDVSLLTNDGEPQETIDGMVVYSCKKHFSNRLMTLFFAYQQFKSEALEINADIYVLHSPELIPLAFKLQKHGKKIVYDAHEDLPQHILEKEWIPKFFKKPLSKVVEFYMNRKLSSFDYIITPHHHVLEKLKKINKNSDLITNFPIINNSEKHLFNEFSKRDNNICYTGTVYRYSNQECILNALTNIEKVNYQIAGFMDEFLHNKLSKHKSFNKINYWGRIPWNELNDFYNKSIIGVVIYDYKLNLGWKRGSYGTNKLFEYMEAGLPIICTDYVLWKNIVDKYDCGIYVQPNNSIQVENAIKKLLGNKSLAYKMGQNGRNAVLSEFNWSSQEKILLKIFNQIKLK